MTVSVTQESHLTMTGTVMLRTAWRLSPFSPFSLYSGPRKGRGLS